MTLQGQSALVTGGGSGLGLALAKVLVRDGAAVVLMGRSQERLDAGAAAIREETPDASVHLWAGDVSSAQDCDRAARLAGEAGRFTMCAVNAGFGSAAPFHLTSETDWNAIIGTNLTGAFHTMQAVVPHLVEHGGGSIVAVSSIAGHTTHRFMTPYAVSKAGLEMLVKQVADELGIAGVRCNAVRPGLVPTDASVGLTAVPVIVDDYMAQMPLARMGGDDEVAALMRFLLGPESSWITGQCIGIDGGHSLRRGPDLTPVMEMVYGDTIRPRHA